MPDLTFDLYRACKRNRREPTAIQQSTDGNGGASTLYPDYDGFQRKDGSFRAPDVTTFTDSNGVTWITGVADIDPDARRRLISSDEGVSLSKAPGKFGYAMWYYFLLPEGTAVPVGFDVVQTGSDKSHYSIRCINRLRKDSYEGALDNMARAAIAKAVEASRKYLHFA